jgi:3-hydroxyisobutyrate dehydrogenase-like beta-hydroxyacid dehydrogenase
VTKRKVGILHPGQMGISVAASIQNSGHMIYWASEGRSQATHERAEKFGLLDARTLAALCATCTVIVSVCPPHIAEETASQVLGHAFRGLYLDANAISPQRVIRMEQAMQAAGVTFVDGGIIGGPAWEAGQTRLYLSGQAAEQVAECFSGGALQAIVIGESVGKASALKMCYAAYSKGTTALLCGVLAAADQLGVRGELEHEWSQDEATFAEQAGERVRRVTAKAWRFEGEMAEIADTFREAGLPDGFHAAAGEIYRRLADYKDAAFSPSLEEVLAALRGS